MRNPGLDFNEATERLVGRRPESLVPRSAGQQLDRASGRRRQYGRPARPGDQRHVRAFPIFVGERRVCAGQPPRRQRLHPTSVSDDGTTSATVLAHSHRFSTTSARPDHAQLCLGRSLGRALAVEGVRERLRRRYAPARLGRTNNVRDAAWTKGQTDLGRG